MEKKYFIVDAMAPGDNSIVKLEDDKSLFFLEEAEAFLAEHQTDLETPQQLDDNTLITKRYAILEAPEVPLSTE